MTYSQETLEKDQLFYDVFDGKIPKRVPVNPTFQIEMVLEYAGFSLLREQYSVDKMIEATEKFVKDVDTDTVSVFAMRFPQVYKIMGSRNFVMGSDGFLQHPNVVGMEIEDYDALIKDPYKTLVGTIMRVSTLHWHNLHR
jgi:hypothetical protein